MGAAALHIVGCLSRVSPRDYESCFPSEWARPDGIAPTTPEQFLAAGPEESRWRLVIDKRTLDVSQWETPKRTRTYPLPRVYRLLQSPNKKVALIPVVKDEGSGVNPDVLGLDTIHLLTLFGVYVVVGHYVSARAATRTQPRSGRTIRVLRDQRLDYAAALRKLEIVAAPEVSVTAWNRGEVEGFPVSLEEAARAYRRMQAETGVPLPTIASCERRLAILRRSGLAGYVRAGDRFRKRSQHAEIVGLQPKEHLLKTAVKVLVDIRLDCDLGAGAPVWLHLAPDEGWIVGRRLFIIEKKANPSENDLLSAVFKNRVFRSMTPENVKNPVQFAIGATYRTRVGACWSLCPHLSRCLRESFVDCRFAPLQRFNSAATFPQRTGAVALLREGDANDFLTFLTGLRGLREGEEAGIQRVLLSACGRR